MIEVTLLGTGSPIPDPNRAGPSTLVRAGGQVFLVDCGRGVLQRAAAVGVGASGLSALLLTHLHSDHIAELGDVLITSWVTNFAPDPAPLPIIGPPGTTETVEATLKAFGHDIDYSIAHHADLNAPPPIEVHEYTDGPVWDRDGVTIRVAPTDHRPVAATIGFGIEFAGASVVLAGDTVPCASLDELAAGAGALVHTVIRRDILMHVPQQPHQRHLRLPLVGAGGSRNRGARGRRHLGPDALCAGYRTWAKGAVAGAGRGRIQRADRARRRPAPGRGPGAAVTSPPGGGAGRGARSPARVANIRAPQGQ
jgi:ribonuclease Z